MSTATAEPPSKSGKDTTPLKPYEPTITDFHRANVAVLADRLPRRLDALFLHGSCLRDPRADDIILRQASEFLRDGGTKCLVINGIDDMPGAYPGAKVWRKKLADLDVPDHCVLEIPQSDKTAIESANFLNLADEQMWGEIAISSTPHHQMRCFLQLIAEMQKRGEWSHIVYNLPTRGIPWNWILTKPSINPTVLPVVGNLEVHSQLEVQNILKYAVPYAEREGITNFTPHATIEEMFQYFLWRDKDVPLE